MKPVIALDHPMDRKTQHFEIAMVLEHGRISPSMFIARPKKKLVLVHHDRIEITAHALERLIQYYQLRDFTRMPQPIANALLRLTFEMPDEPPADNYDFFLVNKDRLDGHLVMVHDPEYDVMVAVTFVGARSYSPAKRRWVRGQSYDELQMASFGGAA